MVHDDIITARAELTARIAAIEWRAGPARLAPDLERIEALARQHQLSGAAEVANQLRRALARGERGAPVHHWLRRLGASVAEAPRRAA